MVVRHDIRTIRARNIALVSSKFARIEYEIPERYQNAFYLANAAFFDSTNWFLHRAYEVVFPTLKNNYRASFQDRNVGDQKVHEKLENIVEVLDQCNSVIDVRFPLKRDNGRWEIVRGFRAHYGETVRQTPCLGDLREGCGRSIKKLIPMNLNTFTSGLRLSDSITRDQMKALSVISAMKNSCLGIGLSGAHGGIKVDPAQYSDNELRKIFELYVTELYKKGYCGHRDVIHPDINTSSREMKWISECFSKCSGQSPNASSVGKPRHHGGVEGYHKTAALGALKSLEVFLNNAPLMISIGTIYTGLKNKKFILQGLGKVGKPLGLMMVEKGAICVGVRDHDAYLYDAKGIDLEELLKHRDQNGSIKNYGLAKTEFPDSIFTEDCDILVLAACHKSLACYAARDVKARVVLEAADGPVTPSAHKILTSKSKLVVPDIYACGGAVVASYFEYLKNLQQIGFCGDTVLSFSNDIYAKIFKSLTHDKQKMVAGGRETQDVESVLAPLDENFVKTAVECVFAEVGQEIMRNLDVHKLGVDIRTAAYAVAIKNIFNVIFEEKRLI